MPTMTTNLLPSDTVLNHIVDVHCHPTDAASIPIESMGNLKITICAMSSRRSDQSLVRALATAHPNKVIPCFGYHPWFSYAISLNEATSKEEHYHDLFSDNGSEFDELMETFPDPIQLSDVLAEVRENLKTFPNAMLGEVGFDRAFRVPYDYDESPRRLSSFIVPIHHQVAVLEAQIDLAVELQRNISLHSVKAQLHTKDLLDRTYKKYGAKWHRISVDLHSCGLSADMWRDIESHHCNVFLSLSTVINTRSQNHISLIKACSADRILVESDINHVEACTERTWDMVKIVAGVKGWPVEKSWDDEGAGVVHRLEQNWIRFTAGNHHSVSQSANGK